MSREKKLAVPLAACLLAAVCISAYAGTPEPVTAGGRVPHIAIVASGGSFADAVTALVEVQLSQSGDCVLIDRVEIGKTLVEHEMQFNGCLSTEDALQAGKLLQCGIFAEIGIEGKSASAPGDASIVAYDAVTGLRLCDEGLSMQADPAVMAAQAVKLLLAATAKFKSGRESNAVRYLSVLDVRNVDLPLAMAGLPDSFGMLVERRLIRCPTIAVLERRRLDQVNKEAVLTGDQREQLLASSIMLEFELSRADKDSGLAIKGFLNDSGGKAIGLVSVQVSSGDIDKAVTLTVEKILSELKMAPLSNMVGIGKMESDRYTAQYRRLRDRERRADALRAIEAAVALDADNGRKQQELCRAMEYVGLEYAKKSDLLQVLDIAERDMSIHAGWISTAYVPAWDLEYQLACLLRCLIANAQNLKETDRSRVNDLRGLYREWFDYYYAKYPKQRSSRAAPFVDIWAKDANEHIAWLLKYTRDDSGTLWLYSLCRLFDDGRSGSGEQGDQWPGPAYSFRSLSPDIKKGLMDYYDEMGAKGCMRGYFSAIQLAKAYPDAYDVNEEWFQDRLDAALGLALARKKDTSGLFAFMFDVGKLNLSADILLPVLRRLASATEDRKVVITTLAMMLDDLDKDASSGHGEHIVRACREIQDPAYSLCAAAYMDSVFKLSYRGGLPSTREEGLAELQAYYRRKYHVELSIGSLPTALARPKPVQFSSSRKLMELQMTGKRMYSEILAAELDGDTIYVLVKSEKPAFYSLHEIDLRNGKSAEPTTIETDKKFDFGMSIGSKCVYVPGEDGVILFPRAGGKPRIVVRGTGILAGVDCVIELDDHLYIGASKMIEQNGMDYSYRVTDGYLLKSDLDLQNAEVIASSAKREAGSILDNTHPYRIMGFFHDSPRKRLAFTVDAKWGSKNRGLYVMDLEKGSISKLFGPNTSLIAAPRPWFDGNCLLGGDYDSMALWQCADDRRTNFINTTRSFGQEPVFNQDNARPDAVVLLNDVLYSVGDDGHRDRLKRIARGEKWADAPRLPPLQDDRTLFLRVWQGKLIACTEDAVWLLSP